MKFLIATLLLLSSTSAFANDAEALRLLTEAQASYAKRDTVVNGVPTEINKAIELLNQAEAYAESDEVKFDVQILSSRCLYYRGTRTQTKAEKLAVFEQAMAKAAAAKLINEDLAEGYYYYGLSLGRWAETKGVMESLSRKKELMDTMKASQANETRTGGDGQEIDGFGADRILGRVYYKLPGFAGGSRTESLKHLKKAHMNAPINLLNGIYYAETLHDGGNDAEKAQACQLLKEAAEKKTEDLDQSRLPESLEDIEIAKRTRADLCR